MHFLEALAVAQHVHREHPDWTIVAIGRFVPPGEIKLGTPWGISVLEPGEEKPRVIWRREDLDGPTAPAAEPENVTNTATAAVPEGLLF